MQYPEEILKSIILDFISYHIQSRGNKNMYRHTITGYLSLGSYTMVLNRIHPHSLVRGNISVYFNCFYYKENMEEIRKVLTT